MKIIGVLFSFALALAAAASTLSIAHAHDHASVPALVRDDGQVLAYGADTVCKLGCWG
jgi:hypothetical protein